MIDLFSLGVSIALGVPTANWINKTLFDKEYKEIRRVTKTLDYLFTEQKIYNLDGNKPKVTDIKITDYGYYITLDIQGITTYSSLSNLNDYIKSLFMAYHVEVSSNKGNIVNLDIITKDIKELNYKAIDLEPTKLVFGYDLKGNPIIVDMLKTPHVGVVGTSNNGKSKCIEGALKNLKGSNITLVNTFKKDFRGIIADRVNGNKEILEYLKRVSENKTVRETPLYIVIDEYNTLSNVKGIDKVVQDLLSQARHYNVYIIVIMQKGNSEDCKFKQLFNTRIAFRTVEESTLRAFLGVTLGSGALNQREFYLLHSTLEKGRTYTI